MLSFAEFGVIVANFCDVPQLLLSGVAVEKVHFPQNSENLGIENV
jgi:hypothetical protein